MLYNKVNQYMNTYIPSFSYLPSLPSILSSRSLQSIRVSFRCYTADSHQFSVLHMVVYIHKYQSLHLPQYPLPTCVHMSILYICVSIPALETSSSVPFFQIPHNMHYYWIFAFIFLTSLCMTNSRSIYILTNTQFHSLL